MNKPIPSQYTKTPLALESIAECLELVLSTAASLEMQLILGFDAVIATKIVTGFLYGEGEKDIVRNALSEAQFKTVFNAFQDINQVQLNYFLVTGEEREKILTEIRKLGLDLNKDFPENYSYGGSWP